MKRIFLVCFCFFALASNAFAWPRSRGVYQTTPSKTYSYTSNNVGYGENSTAQGVANIMARMRRVGHFGGNTARYEGCGSGPTQQSAYNNCCYANSGLTTVDVGYAQDDGGRWYCCRRYR
jgi:hypothetical protein